MSIATSPNKNQEKNVLQSFTQLSDIFEEKFSRRHFPEDPQQLYDASQYLLTVRGKRIRPVMCLMANEMFEKINEDSFAVAFAIELFHNFTLIHDDIMDRAPLRRGMETVHTKYGESTALLAGDVVLITAYENLNRINNKYLHSILNLFNSTAKKVCEGQQLDMEFEKQQQVSFDDYVKMIGLKTSVLLAASLQMGAILGGAGLGNQDNLYEFGKNLGIAFQIQDDYLDAFGDPQKFGKKPGGDIMANKKTFLWLRALEAASSQQKNKLSELLLRNDENKIEEMLQVYKSCNIDDWAKELKQKYFALAMRHLEEIAVVSARKKPLSQLAEYLMDRDV
jgi:geranylgeranyl diphosphate synthase type II